MTLDTSTYPDPGGSSGARTGRVGPMDPLLPAVPADDRWSSASMRLADLEVVIDLDHHLALDWALGATKTLLGTSINVREPLVPTVDGPGIEVQLPLVGVAGITLLGAVHEAGADADNLRSVVRNTDHDHRGPVAASRLAAHIYPAALAAAAARYEDPSLLSPLRRTDRGWVFGEAVAATLAGFSYDEDGWVTAVRLADVGDVAIVADAQGHCVQPKGGTNVAAAAVELFRRGRTLQEVSAVLGCPEHEVEHALRQRI